MNPLHTFNLRVYGLWIDDQNDILLSDEIIWGKKVTKFPGGGLIPGESTIEGLKREWKEELHVDIEVIRHFYTTDFMVPSFMDDGSQVISIYYFVKPINPQTIKVSVKKFDFPEETEKAESFRKVNIKDLKDEDLSFPIDRIVLKKLTSKR
jgi:ADP-ribose pyrophosphatase YjhB (NUDIX family)